MTGSSTRPEKGTQAWHRMVIVERLDALGAQSVRALADLGVSTIPWPSKRGEFLSADQMNAAEAGKRRELAGDLIQTLRAVEACRRALDAEDPWALAYSVFGAAPGFIAFNARRGERSMRGARSGGKARSQADRDREILGAYEADLARSNRRSPGASRQRIAQAWGMTDDAVRKALYRARRPRSK